MLSDLKGRGWLMAEPPEPSDEDSVLGRCNGIKVKMGVTTETITDNESEWHIKTWSGPYVIDFKLDFDIGRGQVKVKRAEAV